MSKKIVLTLLFFVILIVCIVASILAPLRMTFAIFTNQDRAWTIAKSYDFLGNAVLNGKHDEFISRRAYRGMIEGRRSWCVLCKLLDLIDKDHCFKSR
jgi:hypothetical protein